MESQWTESIGRDCRKIERESRAKVERRWSEKVEWENREKVDEKLELELE